MIQDGASKLHGMQDKWLIKKFTDRNNQKSTGKMAGPHIEGRILKTIIEGRMEGKKTHGRPKMKLLNWMIKEGYSMLKERIVQRDEW